MKGFQTCLRNGLPSDADLSGILQKPARAAPQTRFNRGDESVRIAGLAKHAGELLRIDLVHVCAAYDHYRDAAGLGSCFQFLVDVAPVQAGQCEVENDQRRQGLLDLAQRVGAILNGDHGTTSGPERQPEQITKLRIVLDDENGLSARSERHDPILGLSFHP